mmetsp:Transcript_617/g.1048  ORF Transcript_617/g.1048 Transcript_617/m.1048 type:complete len:376 (-) Transcript_617:42-1169(-)
MLPRVFSCVASVLLPTAFALSGGPVARSKVMKQASLVSVSYGGGIKKRSAVSGAREFASREARNDRIRRAHWRKNPFKAVRGPQPSKEAMRKAEEQQKANWWLNLQSSQEYLLNKESVNSQNNKDGIIQYYSQNDEDGIIEYLFKNLNTTNKYYVEFGAEDGRQDNTRRLREHFGWYGLTMDKQFENKTIGLFKEQITPGNIAGIFRKHRVPKDIDLLSVDVDSFDVFVLRSILNAGYRPRVMVVEANDNFGEDSFLSFPGDVQVKQFSTRAARDCGQMCSFADPRDEGKFKTAMCGASARAVDYIAGQAGYQSVYLNKVNLFLVRQDLLPSRMHKSWPLRYVLRMALRLNREPKVFPRKDCHDLTSGLVDVRDF